MKTTGSTGAPTVSDETVAEIRRITAKHSIWCDMPDVVAALFARRRTQEFAVLAQIGWPLLVGMMVLVVGVLWMQLGSVLVGADGVVWWWMVGIVVSLVSTGLLIMQRPSWHPFYVSVVSLLAALLLATLLVGSFLFRNVLLAQEASYVVILVVCVIALALRLPLQAGVGACLGGLGLAAVVISSMGVRPPWGVVLIYYLGSVMVTLLIGVIMERQERVNFLQSLLLEHESAERIRLNAVLERLASEDQLTGLANRRRFNGVLHSEWERCKRNRQPLTLLFIDIDYFKRYNDTYGHAAGDDCLAAVAQGIKGSLLRPADLAARYGGEEFVVLLPETDLAGGREVADRILAHIDALAIPHRSSDAAAHVTTSIGIALQVPDKNSTSQFLLEAADQALYEAKESGRHRACTYAAASASAPAVAAPAGE